MRDVRLDAEQRLAVDLEVHLPLGDRVMTCGVHIAPQALQTAHKMALQKQIDKEKDPDRKEALQKALQTVQKELDDIIKKPS